MLSKEPLSSTPENPPPDLICQTVSSAHPDFHTYDLLQSLSYSLYRPAQNTLPDSFSLPPHGWDRTCRIVAKVDSLRPASSDLTTTGYTQEIIYQAKIHYPRVAGFYQLSFGQVQEDNGRLVPPPEIGDYLDWSGWTPDQHIAYISALSFNPSPSFYPQRLPEILHAIHAHGSRLISQHFLADQPHQILAIMAPHVAKFVERANISITRLGGSLRWRDTQGQLTEVAKSTFMAYPGYWGTEDSPESRRPQLWEIGLSAHA